MMLAICARDRLRADGIFAPPASLLVAMFLGIILLPITLYLYLAHPSWTWMYLVDPQRLPGFAVLPLTMAHIAVVVLGWYLGARLILMGKLDLAAYGSAGGGALTLLGVILLWGRLGHYGTYLEYRQGRSLPIMDVKLGYVLVALLVGTLISASFVAVELLRDSRRVRNR